MASLCQPAQDSVAAQAEMFRRARVEFGLTPDVIHQRFKPLKVSTMREWAKGAAAMPAWAIGALGEAGVPDDLLSLVMEPFARHVSTNADEDQDLDGLAEDAAEYSHEYARARHPSSPGGVSIVPQEKTALVDLGGRLKARARRSL